MNYSYDLCGSLVGIRTTYDKPRFHAVKDAAVNSSRKKTVCRHVAMLGVLGTFDMLFSNKF